MLWSKSPALNLRIFLSLTIAASSENDLLTSINFLVISERNWMESKVLNLLKICFKCKTFIIGRQNSFFYIFFYNLNLISFYLFLVYVKTFFLNNNQENSDCIKILICLINYRRKVCKYEEKVADDHFYDIYAKMINNLNYRKLPVVYSFI